jgi:hypothetical protein
VGTLLAVFPDIGDESDDGLGDTEATVDLLGG